MVDRALAIHRLASLTVPAEAAVSRLLHLLRHSWPRYSRRLTADAHGCGQDHLVSSRSLPRGIRQRRGLGTGVRRCTSDVRARRYGAWSLCTFYLSRISGSDGLATRVRCLALAVAVVALGRVGGGARVCALDGSSRWHQAHWSLLTIVGGAGPSRLGLMVSVFDHAWCAVASGTGSPWRDYLTVLRNMFAWAPELTWNMAPDAAWPLTWAPARRRRRHGPRRRCELWVSWPLALVGTWLSRRAGGLPAAAVLASAAMLLIPGTLWYHYLAVLLPIAAMAWPWLVGTALESCSRFPVLIVNLER